MNRSLAILAVIAVSFVSPLFADEKADSSKPSATGKDEAKEVPLSPEAILEKQFEGKATVELQVGEVHTLNTDALFVPDVSHDQIITAKLSGAKSGDEFVVIVKREVATRMLQLGIDDPAEQFRGKILRVSGIVERLQRASNPPVPVFRILVTDLDQLESIRKAALGARRTIERKADAERSNADKLKANPDDQSALKAFVSEMERSIKFLADQDAAAPAQEKLDEMKGLLDSLKPSTSEGQQRLSRTQDLTRRLEADVERARTPLAHLEAKLAANPHDQNALNRYMAKALRSVYRVLRSNPDQADAGIRAIRERLAIVRESADESLQKQLDDLEGHLANYDKSVASYRELLKLVGMDAVPLNIQAWVNGAPLTEADLKGQVVLLDFWAVWCGPCIRTFPELREWHEKYADKGLTIVGLTDYFNYAWNEETGLAGKSESEVSPEQEQAMLQKFATHHNLPFRIGIQHGIRTLDSEMAKYYKVSGLPYVVIIDQQGKVRLLRDGNSERNTKDIAELLEQLLGASPADHPEVDTPRQK